MPDVSLVPLVVPLVVFLFEIVLVGHGFDTWPDLSERESENHAASSADALVSTFVIDSGGGVTVMDVLHRVQYLLG